MSLSWGQTPSRSSGSICASNLPSIRHFFLFELEAKVRLGLHLKALEVDTDVCSYLFLFWKFSLGQVWTVGWHGKLPLAGPLWLWSSLSRLRHGAPGLHWLLWRSNEKREVRERRMAVLSLTVVLPLVPVSLWSAFLPSCKISFEWEKKKKNQPTRKVSEWKPWPSCLPPSETGGSLSGLTITFIISRSSPHGAMAYWAFTFQKLLYREQMNL